MPIAKKEIPADFFTQMKNNVHKDVFHVGEEQNVDLSSQSERQLEPIQTSVESSLSKGKYADVMNIRLSPGRRDEIKKFCTNCGVTITQYIEASFEFLEKEVAAGNVVISKGGISKKVE